MLLALWVSCSLCVDWRPVVLMHGIGADANSMSLPVAWIKAAFPGIYVKNIEIGNGYWDSFFIKMSDQVDLFASQVREDPNLKRGFNLVGYSQGSLITRGYIERYNDPPVHNYITWSGPHAGTFGIPVVEWTWLFKDIWDMLYDAEVQQSVTFAQYWRDPYDLPVYLEVSLYLADLNNERPAKNETYKQNIISLNNMVLLYTTVDDTVLPGRSGWFETYAPNDDSKIVPLEESALFVEDWIGLKVLNTTNRLHRFSCSCKHNQYPDEICHPTFDLYTLPYLNNTFTDM
uniref:Palmitoyl-protein thioesterase 1 n=1 Tax=Arcella intermedia TaxID=1963864 RepID=A0A6B2LC86_9EUKA